jgi:hypothetical protein
LSLGITRTIAAAGLCGIPPAAKTVAVNLTAVGPTAPGHLTIFPAGTPIPATSSMNFSAGTVRANNAVLPLWDGALEVLAVLGGGGQVDLIVDVSGYFQ